MGLTIAQASARVQAQAREEPDQDPAVAVLVRATGRAVVEVPVSAAPRALGKVPAVVAVPVAHQVWVAWGPDSVLVVALESSFRMPFRRVPTKRRVQRQNTAAVGHGQWL